MYNDGWVGDPARGRRALDQFARVVLGYHGCNTPTSVEFAPALRRHGQDLRLGAQRERLRLARARDLLLGARSPAAREWAAEGGTVIGAVIQLGRCFDLTDIRYTKLLREAYDSVVALYEEEGLTLPKNRGRDWNRRELDCLIVDRFMDATDNELIGDGETAFGYQTVRCPFEEGDEAFPGSMLKTQTHIQISVRDPTCILGVFRPNV